MIPACDGPDGQTDRIYDSFYSTLDSKLCWRTVKSDSYATEFMINSWCWFCLCTQATILVGWALTMVRRIVEVDAAKFSIWNARPATLFQPVHQLPTSPPELRPHVTVNAATPRQPPNRPVYAVLFVAGIASNRQKRYSSAPLGGASALSDVSS